MAGIEASEETVQVVKRFSRSTNKNKFVCLTIGKDEDGLEEVQLFTDPDSGHNRDHLGGHPNPKKGPSFVEEAKEHGHELDPEEESRDAKFEVLWGMMQSKIKKNKKDGKYFFIKIPYEKGGAVSEAIAFVLYPGTRKKSKMIFSMTSRSVKEWVSIKTTIEDPLNMTAAEAQSKLADFV